MRDLSEEIKRSIVLRAADFSLENANIEFVEGLHLNRDVANNTESANLRAEVNRLNAMVNYRQRTIDSLQVDDKLSAEILPEVKQLFPHINNLYYSQRGLNRGDSLTKIPFIFFVINKGSSNPTEKQKVADWIKVRLKIDSIETFFIE